ncbi:MAG: hypothetical protein QNJ32_29525 [Xenococcaceae cyanobacterium MO_167.B27]|nr:hypothetical protein [Xenococcaceae cyanobacterium MO_167.B27]
MTTQESKQQYEGAILQQLIKNSERLAVMERDISEIKKSQETAKWLLITITVGIIINIISPPFVTFFNH